MLPLKNRLRKKTEIDNVFKRGKSFREDFLVIKLFKNSLTENRFGFLISQKVSKKAVERNRIKRLLSLLMRENFPNKEIKFDCLLIVMPGWRIKDLNSAEIIVQKLILKTKITQK